MRRQVAFVVVTGLVAAGCTSGGSAGVSSAIDAARDVLVLVLVLDGASGTAFVLRPFTETAPDDAE